jgi:transcriptional regulator with XRE-family HTH domain
MQAFSDWLRERRAERNWSQTDLSRASTVDSSNITRWETGATRPSPANLAKIAPALGVPYEDLLKRCGYLPGTPEPTTVQSELQTRMARVSETLSRYPRPFWESVLRAIEAMATAGEALQAPTNGSGLTENNPPSTRLSGHQTIRKRRITTAYAWATAHVRHGFHPLASVTTQS